MNLVDSLFAYYDAFQGKYDFLVNVHDSEFSSETEVINANNQFLSDLINAHAKSNLVSKYVSLNSQLFNRHIAHLFGHLELIREIIKVGSNLSEHFGYCGFSSDTVNITEGFSLVIDRHSLAFSHNDVHSVSDLIAKNIRFRKVVYVPTKFDPAYQLPTYSIYGVSFNVVPGEKVQHPFIEF